MEQRTTQTPPNPITQMTINTGEWHRIALRPAEAAEAIGISVRKLHDLLKSGEIKYAKLDRAVLIPIASLEEFITRKTVQVCDQEQAEEYAPNE